MVIFLGMAHCLWLKGQIAFAENKISEAQSNWKKAEGIFISLNDTQALQKLRQDINKLPQEQMK
jgi:Fe-S cluster assembly ATPase SufC